MLWMLGGRFGRPQLNLPPAADYFRGFKAPAFIVVDMQSRFVRLVDRTVRSRITAIQLKVLHHCAENDVPSVLLQDAECGSSLAVLSSAHRQVPRGHIARKKGGDGFRDTNLEEWLREHCVREILFAGVYANACVLATVEGAIRRGFVARTSASLIADCRCAQVKEQTLDWYRKNHCLLEGER
jgi:nicotinamidase-related amidase